MTVYEHDQTAVGELDQKWIPVLKGEIFCSPACGGKCKKSAYDKAIQISNEIAAQLGEGWLPKVYENLGWHWKVEKGNLQVSSATNGYNAVMQFKLDQNYHFNAKDLDPRKAVQKVRAQLQDVIGKLERQFSSSALNPISISTSCSE